MFRLFKEKISIEEQIEKLKEIGININSGITVSLFLEEFTQEEFEADPYQLLLISMGGELYKDGEFYVASDQMWYLDTECIEDHGDYVSIIERLVSMSRININNIRDFVDIENETVWVSFKFNNKSVKWNLKINDDWLDPEIFELLNRLVKDETNKRFVISIHGQFCLIAFLNSEQIKNLNKLVKSKFN